MSLNGNKLNLFLAGIIGSICAGGFGLVWARIEKVELNYVERVKAVEDEFRRSIAEVKAIAEFVRAEQMDRTTRIARIETRLDFILEELRKK